LKGRKKHGRKGERGEEKKKRIKIMKPQGCEDGYTENPLLKKTAKKYGNVFIFSSQFR